MLIVVPDVPGTKAVPTQSLGAVSTELIGNLKEVLAAAKAVINKSADAQVQSAEASASLIKNRELVALAKETPELKQRLSQIADQTKTQAKQVAEDKKTQMQAVAQLEKELASLIPQ